MKRTELFVLLLIIAVAAGFRLYALGNTPPGLYPDEAMNGNNAVQARETHTFRLFYPEDNGREGLFINLQALSVHLLGNTPQALRVVSAFVGILTVLGTYLLARRMFDDWELAAMAAFLMAVGFWHVNFSRIGFRSIMAPLMAVWGFYYLYKGIETHRLWHWAMAGLFFGLGFHTYLAFRVMPLSIAVTLGAYWLALRAVFSHGKYADARRQMLGGAAMLVSIMILALLPMAAYFYVNPGDFVGRTAQVSVFASAHPFRELGLNFLKTMGMFFFQGDMNWRHNIPGEPILFLPVAALFAVGLLRNIWRFFHSWRTRGHPGLVQTLLLSWFFVGLIPAMVSDEGIPHALRSLIVAPAVYLMAGQGLHWLFVWLRRWYGARDSHQICLPAVHIPGTYGHRICFGEGTLIVGFTTVVFLLAVGIADAGRYFVQWGNNPVVAASFDEHTSQIARQLNGMPPATLKYVVVNRGGVLVNGIPMPAQPIMYLTDTFTAAKQRAKNIYYLTPQQFDRKQYPRGAFVIRLDP